MVRSVSWLRGHRVRSIVVAVALAVVLASVTAFFAVMASAGSTAAGEVSRANTVQNALGGVPSGAASDASGNVYATCNGDAKFQRISTGGSPVAKIYDIDAFRGVVVDTAGYIYAAEADKITKFAPGGSVASSFTVSGTALNGAWGLSIDPNNDKRLYVANSGNHVILKLALNAAGTAATSTVLAGAPGTQGGPGLGGSSVATSAARFRAPRGVAVDAQGNVWVADTSNSAIRKIDPAAGTVLTVTTNGSSPGGVAVDRLGNVYYSGTSANVIRKIAAGSSTPVTFAGSGTPGYLDSTNPLTARFNAPSGIAVNWAGTKLLVAENSNNVRTVDLSTLYHLATNSGVNGTITPVSQDVTAGATSAYFTIAATTAHYHVGDVLVDGVSVGTPTSYRFTNVSKDSTLSAVFAIDTNTITASAGPHGSITPAGLINVPWRGSQTCTITPIAHYHVANVLVDGTSVGAVTNYTFSDVQVAHTIAASFAGDVYTLAYSAGSGGSIVGTATQSVAYQGSGTAVTATPAAGQHFVNWSDGVTTATRTDANVAANLSVSATFAPDTFTLAYSAGSGGSIVGTATQSVAYQGSGTAVTATPAAGQHFVSWSDGVTTAMRTDANVVANLSVSATFAIDTNAITASAGTHGAVSPAGATQVPWGGNLTCSVAPDPHYHTDDVLVDGNSVGAVATYAFTDVRQPHAISASFAIDRFTLAYSAGAGGSIAGSSTQTLDYGATGSCVTATPADGHHFVSWSDGVTTATRTDTNVVADLAVSAAFDVDTNSIAASAGAHGAVTPAGATEVPWGGSQAYAITPDAHYHVAGVLVDGGSAGAVLSYTFQDVKAAHSISATFAIDTYTLAYSAGPNGSITGTTTQTVDWGGSGTAVTAVPGSGHHFLRWSDGVTTATRTDTDVAGDLSVNAQFVGDPPTVVSASAATTGEVDVVFSTALDGSTVQAGDFDIAGLSIDAAALQSGGTTVRLTTSRQQPGKAYTVTVTPGSVADADGGGLVAPNSAGFSGHAGPWVETNPARGLLVAFGLAYSVAPLEATIPTDRHGANGFTPLPNAYYDISTAATFDSSAGFMVTVPYDPAALTGPPSRLRLFHWEGGGWVDITTSVDTANHTVTGRAHSFSDFTLGEVGAPAPVNSPASSDWSLALLAVAGLGLAYRTLRPGGAH